MQPSDHTARQQALNPSTSFICEAPAGSGKTGLITQRFLGLLARVSQPEEVLAITFTRKAVAEMRHRITEALTLGLNNTPPDNEHEHTTWALAREALANSRDHQWHLIDNPNRLRILTFDSLCGLLANHLPFESSFVAPPEKTSNPSDDYRQAARSFLSTLEDDQPWSDSIAYLLSQLDNNLQKLESLLALMLGNREQWLPLVTDQRSRDTHALAALEHSLALIRQDAFYHVKNLITEQQQKQLLELADFAASHWCEAPDAALAQCKDAHLHFSELPTHDDEPSNLLWQGLSELLLTREGTFRKTLNKKSGFPAGENATEKKEYKTIKHNALRLIQTLKDIDGLESYWADITHLPSAHFNDQASELLQALMNVLPILCAYLSVTFKENNRVDFTEVSLKAVDALTNTEQLSDMALILDYQIHHILVDEFQDTSPTQIALLKALTSTWIPDDGRTLFCVGDAMQSIYRFRGAEVGLFLRALTHGLDEHLPLTPIRLTTNFRSQAGIIDWVNQSFECAFPKANHISDGAVRYNPSIAFHPSTHEPAVMAHGFIGDDKITAEAHHVAEIISQEKARDPISSIAILVRNRSHAQPIVQALQSRHIPYQAVELEPLASNSLISDLTALTLALHYPHDRIHWLAILRAPWCGLTLDDLSLIDQDSPIAEWLALELNRSDSALSIDGQTRLARIGPTLLRALSQRSRKPLRTWVEGTWLALGGAQCLRTAADGKNAQLFFELLSSLDSHAVISHRACLSDKIAQLYASADPLADGSLQIMTMHKAKGLEFDTVILPGLDRTPRASDPALLKWRQHIDEQGHTHWLVAPLTASGKTRDPIYHHLSEHDKKREYLEASRLLYVACTRAKNTLHLLAGLTPDAKKKGELKPPSPSSLLHSVWPSTALQFTQHESEVIPATELKPQRLIQRLPLDVSLPELATGHLLDGYIPYQLSQAEQNSTHTLEAIRQTPTQRHTGTVIHRLLQMMSDTGIDYWTQTQQQQHRHNWRNQLIQLGVPLHELEGAKVRVQQAVNTLTEDPTARWLFDQKYTRFAEYSVTHSDLQGSPHRVIDLVLVTDKETWIVDYKTSEPANNSDLNEFIESEKLRYQEIMAQYQRIIIDLGYTNVKTALYFPMISKLSVY